MGINEEKINKLGDMLTIIVGLFWIFKMINTFSMGISISIIYISKFVLYLLISYINNENVRMKSLCREAMIMHIDTWSVKHINGILYYQFILIKISYRED